MVMILIVYLHLLQVTMSEEAISRKLERQFMINSVKNVVEFCVKFDIKIVANQKVVGCDMKELFRQKKILVLERLGYEGIERLKCVSRCYSHSSPDITNRPTIVESLSEFSEFRENKAKVCSRKAK